uniref:Glycosyltransferase family 92 protein n=1 Tax=Oryzias sinensis TaxID=183150 RepID=A0A8C7XXE9_9TELE
MMALKFKKLRRWIFIAAPFFLLLLWICRINWTFHLWTPKYQTFSSPKKCFNKHLVPPAQPATLVAVNGMKTLLVSAYLEHRSKVKKVRIIAIKPRKEKASYLCHLRCEKKLKITRADYKTHSDHFRFHYGTADIMCPLPSGCPTPSHVAVTSAHVNPEGTLDQDFLEVQNLKTEFQSFPFNFTVCFSTMFDYTNVLQLVQSLEMLQLLGVNRVVIYKTNCSLETQNVLDYYTHKGLVEEIPWSLSKYLNVSRGWLPNHGPGELHYFGQIPALNDCLYRYMYKTKYLALHDVDELILPQSVDSWLELLPLLEKKFGANKRYRFRSHVFPNDVLLPPPIFPNTLLQHSWGNVSGVNILSHLYREPLPSTAWIDFKIIVNPREVFSLTVHGALKSLKPFEWVTSDMARMYHTR